MFTNLVKPVLFSLAALTLALTPVSYLQQNPSGDRGIQAAVFENDTITTTTQSAVIACGQGSGDIGRKTLVVDNDSSSDGAITITVELRDYYAAENFTSGYMALNSVATNTMSYTTKTATDAAGRYCQVSATSASTSVITVTLRRE